MKEKLRLKIYPLEIYALENLGAYRGAWCSGEFVALACAMWRWQKETPLDDGGELLNFLVLFIFRLWAVLVVNFALSKSTQRR